MNEDARQADVIVIGAGGAGIMAAMAAADEGAAVLHIEKRAAIGGIWSYLGGTTAGARARMQIEAGLNDDSPALHYADCMKEPKARECRPEVLRYFCEQAGAAVDWLDGIGAYRGTDRKPARGVKGEDWSVLRAYSLITGPLVDIVRPEYEKRLARGNIRLLPKTSATDFILSGGAIAGVVAMGPDGMTREYRARATVLCTGGFAGNLDLVRKYNHPNATDILLGGPAFARGEGLSMCQRVGAMLVNLNRPAAVGPTTGGVQAPGRPGRQIAFVNMNRTRGIIWLDATGKRVINEDCTSRSPGLRAALENAPGQVLLVVFDSKVRNEKDPVFVPWHRLTPGRSWEWFDSQTGEGGIVQRAGTLDELAGKLRVPAPGLRSTVEAWNRCVEVGLDAQFGRKELTWKIDKPPYYGVRTGCMVVNTSGGPATNLCQQVLATGGTVIPGLYAAGEVAGYQAYGTAMFNIGNIVFGKLAGKMAAREALRLPMPPV